MLRPFFWLQKNSSSWVISLCMYLVYNEQAFELLEQDDRAVSMRSLQPSSKLAPSLFTPSVRETNVCGPHFSSQHSLEGFRVSPTSYHSAASGWQRLVQILRSALCLEYGEGREGRQDLWTSFSEKYRDPRRSKQKYTKKPNKQIKKPNQTKSPELLSIRQSAEKYW